MNELARLAKMGALPPFSIFLTNQPCNWPEVFTALQGHDFCGQCPLCRKAVAGFHQDFSQSTDPSMEAARQIVRLVRRRVAEVDRRLIVIIGSRSDAFQDSLLKTLEETPKKTHIIWETSDMSSFLPTVISRARSFRSLVLKEDTVSTGVKLKASELMEAVASRNPIQLANVEIGDSESEIFSELTKASLRLSALGDTAIPLDLCFDALDLVKRKRPPETALFLLTIGYESV